MNYEKKLLERLLELYENSSFYITGTLSRRMMLTAAKESWIQERMESVEEKRQFLDTLKVLKQEGLIDYSWQKYEEGNLIDRIWLNPQLQAIEACYKRLGCVPARQKSDVLFEMIRKYHSELAAKTSTAVFLETYMEKLKASQRIGKFFTDDEKMNEDILKCLVYMENNREEQMERLMSSGLYGDSKRFEQSVKPKVLSILRHIKKQNGEDVPAVEEILLEKGIVRWPEIMEFSGGISVCLRDGEVIDYRLQKYGAYINSETVKHAIEVRMEGIRKVTFIENKANYIWYLAHEKKTDELAVFHGGCYSPIKGRWFRLLYEGGKGQKEKPQYFHWSDIDIGGFRIFHRLQKSMIPELQPYKMDEGTLEIYRNDAMKIQTDSYLENLRALLENPEYACFHGVIKKMIKYGIRLEQEKIIV